MYNVNSLGRSVTNEIEAIEQEVIRSNKMRLMRPMARVSFSQKRQNVKILIVGWAYRSILDRSRFE